MTDGTPGTPGKPGEEVRHVYERGQLKRSWDDISRTLTEYDEKGNPRTRPYNADENAGVVAVEQFTVKQAAEKTLRQQLIEEITVLRNSTGTDDTAGTETLRAIIATGNPAINQSPAQYIKSLARRQRETNRALIRALNLITGELGTSD